MQPSLKVLHKIEKNQPAKIHSRHYKHVHGSGFFIAIIVFAGNAMVQTVNTCPIRARVW